MAKKIISVSRMYENFTQKHLNIQFGIKKNWEQLM